MTPIGRSVSRIALLAAMVAGAPAAGLTQERAGIVTTLQGTATVARVSLPEPSPLKFKDAVFTNDKIATGDNSVARILLGGKAVVTVREHSVLTITEAPTTSTIDLSGGKIALAVAKERMKPGESIEIRTPNAVAGVRGTVVVAEVTPGATGVSSRFTLLTGIIDVTRLDNGSRTGRPLLLTPVQSVTIAGTAASPIRSLSRNDVERIAADYRIDVKEAPKGASDALSQHAVESAYKQLSAPANDPASSPSASIRAGSKSDKGAAPSPSALASGSSSKIGTAASAAPGTVGAPVAGTAANSRPRR